MKKFLAWDSALIMRDRVYVLPAKVRILQCSKIDLRQKSFHAVEMYVVLFLQYAAQLWLCLPAMCGLHGALRCPRRRLRVDGVIPR